MVKNNKVRNIIRRRNMKNTKVKKKGEEIFQLHERWNRLFCTKHTSFLTQGSQITRFYKLSLSKKGEKNHWGT